jgi:hypothetical protein
MIRYAFTGHSELSWTLRASPLHARISPRPICFVFLRHGSECGINFFTTVWGKTAGAVLHFLSERFHDKAICNWYRGRFGIGWSCIGFKFCDNFYGEYWKTVSAAIIRIRLNSSRVKSQLLYRVSAAVGASSCHKDKCHPIKGGHILIVCVWLKRKHGVLCVLRHRMC